MWLWFQMHQNLGIEVQNVQIHITMEWIPKYSVGSKSTLIQEMAWYCQKKKSITWTDVDPDLYHQLQLWFREWELLYFDKKSLQSVPKVRMVNSHHQFRQWLTEPWASCQIRKIAGCACGGNVGNVFPATAVLSDPDIHEGACMPHMPWCISGSLTYSFLWSPWLGKCSRHSRRMRYPQFYVSGMRPMG